MNSPINILLQKLILARGPCGQEDEVRDLCRVELEPIADEIWIDELGNLIAKIDGENPDPAKAMNIMVHMDELSLIVKRINEDGSLRVNPLGGVFPFNWGQGLVEVLGDKKFVPGVLSFGSMHVTKESQTINKFVPEDYRGQGKTVSWEDVCVITRLNLQELEEAGIYPGTRIVMSQVNRQLQTVKDCVAGYFLDNRASIAIAIETLKKIKSNNIKPKNTLYFVGTCSEEVGAHGASYAARVLPGAITLAIDIGPVAKEYHTKLNASPIIVYQDSFALYDKALSDRLYTLAKDLGLSPQRAVFGGYGSDASAAYSRGQSARAALLCFPVENTHGFEMMHENSLKNCVDLLENFFCY